VIPEDGTACCKRAAKGSDNLTGNEDKIPFIPMMSAADEHQQCTLAHREQVCERRPYLGKEECLSFGCCQWGEDDHRCAAALVIPEDGTACCKRAAKGSDNLTGNKDKIPFIPMMFAGSERATPTASPTIASETHHEPTTRPTLSGMTYKGTWRPTLSGMVPIPTLSGMEVSTSRPTLGGQTHGDAPSDPTCLDVLEWCQDPHNFMTRNCPHDPTTEDFDPAECQNLYTMIGQADCIVRAFRSPASSQDPCSTVQLPFGDYDNETLDMLASGVACENFSYANVLCVDEFSKINYTDADSERAFNCIFEAANRPEFAGDADAQACLRAR